MKSYVPSLEKDFRPMIVELRKFIEKGTVPFAICVERQSGYKYRYDLNVMPGKDAENEEMIERIIKSILWVVGGFKIYLGGNDGGYFNKKYNGVELSSNNLLSTLSSTAETPTCLINFLKQYKVN